MDQVTEQPTRDGNGRFVPGQSGNPKGKAPGTRNRATVLRALLRDGDEDAIGRVLIDRALGGDPVAARFLIDALNPKPRQRTITLDLPEGADAAAIFQAAAEAAFAGKISPEEATSVVRLLAEGQRMVHAAKDMARANAAHRAVDAVRAAMTAAAAELADPLHSPCKSTIGDAAGHAPSPPSPASEEGVRVKRAGPPPPAQSDSLPACGVSEQTPPPPPVAMPTRRRAQERARRAAAPLHSACKSTIVDKAPRATRWSTSRPDDKLCTSKDPGGNR
jgi:hypothetical protein